MLSTRSAVACGVLALVLVSALGLVVAATVAAGPQPYVTGPVIHEGDLAESVAYTEPYVTGPVIHESDLPEFLPYTEPYTTGPVIHESDVTEFLPYTETYRLSSAFIHDTDRRR